jgi:hypothetical protein
VLDGRSNKDSVPTLPEYNDYLGRCDADHIAYARLALGFSRHKP